MKDQVDGRRVRWEGHKAERRATILDAALAVLEREPPGTDLHVQQIAEEAGVGRTVIYRHFSDKADLDHALRAHVLAHLGARVLPEVSLTGSVEQVIRRIVGAYVGWAAEHPSLHLVAERAAMNPAGELDDTVDDIGSGVATLIRLGAAAYDVTLSPVEEAALEPLALGLVGAVHAAVHQWLLRDPRTPSEAEITDVLSRSIWYLVEGHLREHGLAVDPTTPIDAVLPAPRP